MLGVLDSISEAIWGFPSVLLIILTGVYLSARLRLIQITGAREIIEVLKKQLKTKSAGNLSCIASSLCATLGTGSIVGVAAAITLGGAGSIFWLWVSAFFGMAVAYAEGVLSIKYREKTKNGYKGGIAYAIRDGVGSKWLAWVYAFLAILTSLGMGSMAQTNAFSRSLRSSLGLSPAISAIICLAVVAICIFGQRQAAERISLYFLPILSICFIGMILAVIISNLSALPSAFKAIISEAFSARAAVGGITGQAVKRAISIGFKRGIFSNEAGLGTTSPLHASAENITPHEQGLMNIFEVFIDTFVVCSLVALAILASGEDYISLTGTELVQAACYGLFGKLSSAIIGISIAGFAIATVIGWSQIGQRSARYLFKGKSIQAYNILYIISAIIGCFLSAEGAFTLSDIFNGLMLYPCIFAILMLSSEIINACPLSQSPFRRGKSYQAHRILKSRGR